MLSHHVISSSTVQFHETNKCTLSIPKDDYNIKFLLSHYFKESENPTKKTWIYPDLELEIFTQNQPDAATFTKSTPITKFKKLVTKTAKKFAKENDVSETIEHTHTTFTVILKITLILLQ
ncbi:33063_t:CDS:2 [Gigaspora margarita]|uniref:33063_t:CDS:1 n=1 Tax=Gigaspora margarita TaxID=4874 RepID=A0ABN7UIR9_GIGMA|nr:33063_t:CDS:2 [Gigaspora margarita]